MKDEALITKIRKSEGYYRHLRHGFEREWYRNLLYKQGHQWIVWDEVGRSFQEKTLAPWVPMPVTNKFASTLDALVALVLRVEPPVQWSPHNEADQLQRMVSETANAVLESLRISTGFQYWRQRLATWLVYTGNGWLHNMYDPSGGSKVEIPYSECSQCELQALPDEFEEGCPNCDGKDFVQALNPNGMPRVEEMQAGEVITEVASPFEMFYDFSSDKLDDLLRLRHRPLEYFARYGARGKEVIATKSSTLAEFYANTLAYVSSGSTSRHSASSQAKRPGATEYVYMALPSDEFKEGVYVVISGEVILEKSELTSLCQGLRGDTFIPVVHIKQDEVPHSSVGKSVANDLAPKQKQRNEFESLMQLIAMRMANPVWLVPHGVDAEEFSGEPGAVIKTYQLSANASSGVQRLAGENIPSSIFQFFEKIDADMEELSSIFDAVKGNVPQGITAGYALQLLSERGMSRWGPLFQRWENGFIQWAEQVTAMTRKHMPVNELQQLLGEHAMFEISKYKEESMTGFQIRAEAGALRPRSALTEQAQVENAMTAGLINPMDPTIKSTLLRNMGLSRYDFEGDWDLKDALREEQGFLQVAMTNDMPDPNEAQDPMMLQDMQMQIQQLAESAYRFRPIIDNHFIHIANHKRFAKTDAYLKLAPQWQAVWLQHLEEHMMVMQQQAMQAQGGMAPGGPPPSGGNPSPFDGASPEGGRTMNPVKQEGPEAMPANPA